MSSRRARVRKRRRKEAKYAAFRLKPVAKPVSRVKTAGLLSGTLQPTTFYGLLGEVFAEQT
jgi:hypothetical protein